MQQSTKTAALSAARPKKQGRFIKDMKKTVGYIFLPPVSFCFTYYFTISPCTAF